MADSDKIVTITPNTSVATTHPEIKFVGKDNSPMYLKVLDDNTLSFEGTEGQVFSITPTLSSGDIFSVNDISGMQSIAVNADGTVALAPVSGNVGIGKQTSLTAKLHINTAGETDALRVDVDSSDSPDATPFVIAEDGRVGIGTASPLSDMALTLNGDGTSYEGLAFQVGGSTKWKMSTDGTAMYVDSQANGHDFNFRSRDGSGNLRPLLVMDGTTKGVTIGNDDGTDSSVVNMNKLQVNLDGGDKSDGILIVSNSTEVLANDVIGGIGFDTRDGNVPSRVTEASAAIVAKAREGHSTGDKGAYLDFLYSPTDQNDDTASSVGMRFMDGKLAVNAGGLDPVNTLVVYHPGNDWNNGLLFVRNDTSVQLDDLLGAIGFDDRDGNNPSSVLEACAGIAGYASQSHSASAKGGYMTIFTSPDDQADDTAALERMRITSAGDVGIGNAATGGYKLDVQSGAADSVARFKSSDNIGRIVIQDDDTGVYVIAQDSYMSLGGTSSLNAANLNIHKTSGNVGIGTPSPSAPLTIVADTDGGDTVRIEGSDSNANLSTPDLTLVRTNGSPGGNTWLGHIHFKGMNNASGTNEELTYASIAGQIDGGADGSEKGRLKFYTMVSGTNTNTLTIDEKKVGIGISEPGHLLEVAGGSFNGEIVVNRTSGAEILLQAQSATGIVGTNSNHDFALMTNSSQRMKIGSGGGIEAISTTRGWNLWCPIIYGKRDYGTTAGSGAALHTVSTTAGEAGLNSYPLPADATLRAVSFSTSSVVLSGTTEQVWRIFANGSSSAGTLTNITLDCGDFTRQNSENSNATNHWYVVDGLDASYNKGDTIGVKRESGAVDMGHIKVTLWWTFDN